MQPVWEASWSVGQEGGRGAEAGRDLAPLTSRAVRIQWAGPQSESGEKCDVAPAHRWTPNVGCVEHPLPSPLGNS